MFDGDHISIPACEPELPKWIWCLVANVSEYPRDDYFNIIKKPRRGTKHFAPGTRVYVYPVQWGDGWDRMVVVGKKRGTHRYVRKVLLGAMLEDFRLKKVYSPTIISWMCGARQKILNHGQPCPPYPGNLFHGWDDSDDSRYEIEQMVDSYEQFKNEPEAYWAEAREQFRREV